MQKDTEKQGKSYVQIRPKNHHFSSNNSSVKLQKGGSSAQQSPSSETPDPLPLVVFLGLSVPAILVRSRLLPRNDSRMTGLGKPQLPQTNSTTYTSTTTTTTATATATATATTTVF